LGASLISVASLLMLLSSSVNFLIAPVIQINDPKGER
jgi:hypothetical protein